MPEAQLKPKYSTSPSGNIFRGEEIVGTFDPATGRILDHSFPEGAMPFIKSLILDVIVEARLADPKVVEFPQVHTEEAMRAEVDTSVPPAPAMNPRLGDKTPEYVLWMQVYHPEEYEKKYKDRRTHISTGGEPFRGKGDIPANQMRIEVKEEWK
jgi:hypothetical protein